MLLKNRAEIYWKAYVAEPLQRDPKIWYKIVGLNNKFWSVTNIYFLRILSENMWLQIRVGWYSGLLQALDKFFYPKTQSESKQQGWRPCYEPKRFLWESFEERLIKMLQDKKRYRKYNHQNY